ncbi:brain-specific homeobox/POU domain protein 3 [Lates japonicus]|uniref:Brain-specific homeobox/POU domain protein 3 n=1 Tax=Lates japonicus TaxID=270547 RepID=A0AAD3M2U4_LATJO|nr:brain-specific homeobox/POU domain protein 3 [Lates japonicus]
MMSMNSKQPFSMHPILHEPKYTPLHSSSEAIRRACLPTPSLQGNIFAGFDETLLQRAEALAAVDIVAQKSHPFKPDATYHTMTTMTSMTCTPTSSSAGHSAPPVSPAPCGPQLSPVCLVSCGAPAHLFLIHLSPWFSFQSPYVVLPFFIFFQRLFIPGKLPILIRRCLRSLISSLTCCVTATHLCHQQSPPSPGLALHLQPIHLSPVPSSFVPLSSHSVS